MFCTFVYRLDIGWSIAFLIRKFENSNYLVRSVLIKKIKTLPTLLPTRTLLLPRQRNGNGKTGPRQYLVIYWVTKRRPYEKFSLTCIIRNLFLSNVSQILSSTRAMSVMVCRCEELQTFILTRTKPGPL